MDVKIEQVEEIFEDGALVAIRIFGEWEHTSGKQPLRLRVTDVDDYVDATAAQKRAFIDAAISAHVRRSSVELDERPVKTSTMRTDERTITV